MYYFDYKTKQIIELTKDDVIAQFSEDYGRKNGFFYSVYHSARLGGYTVFRTDAYGHTEIVASFRFGAEAEKHVALKNALQNAAHHPNGGVTIHANKSSAISDAFALLGEDFWDMADPKDRELCLKLYSRFGLAE